MSKYQKLIAASGACASSLFVSFDFLQQKQNQYQENISSASLKSTSFCESENNRNNANASNATTKSFQFQHVARKQETSTGTPSILFLGSGSSTGCPKPLCAILPPPITQDSNSNNKEKQLFSCHVSQLASQGNPKHNKNYRNNPSILISHLNHDVDNDDDNSSNSKSINKLKHVIIDVGKTFREGALRWMPSHNTSIDAIILTHEHMDAIGGLDDVRGFQKIVRTPHDPHQKFRIDPIPVFLSNACLEAISKQFYYLVPEEVKLALLSSSSSSLSLSSSLSSSNNTDKTEKESNGETNGVTVKRHVAALDYHVITPFKPFIAAGLKVVPLPVMHGEDMICLGFAFSLRMNESSSTSNGADTNSEINVVYLSDLSRMLPSTQTYILEELPPTDILVIDSLLVDRKHPTHYCLTQAIEMARTLGAKQTFIVGMNCDAFKPHDEMNEELSKLEDVDVQLAHDGLVLRFDK